MREQACASGRHDATSTYTEEEEEGGEKANVYYFTSVVIVNDKSIKINEKT